MVMKAINTISPRLNQVLEVISTDPRSVAGFGAFCRATGNELIEQNEADGIYSYLIRKAG